MESFKATKCFLYWERYGVFAWLSLITVSMLQWSCGMMWHVYMRAVLLRHTQDADLLFYGPALTLGYHAWSWVLRGKSRKYCGVPGLGRLVRTKFWRRTLSLGRLVRTKFWRSTLSLSPELTVRPMRGFRVFGSPPPMSSRHRNLEPLGRWHATIYYDIFYIWMIY